MKTVSYRRTRLTGLYSLPESDWRFAVLRDAYVRYLSVRQNIAKLHGWRWKGLGR